MKNLAQRNYCDLEKSVAITFTKGGILCDMIRYDYNMKFCEECGAKLDDDSTFCEECGAQVATVTSATILIVQT